MQPKAEDFGTKPDFAERFMDNLKAQPPRKAKNYQQRFQRNITVKVTPDFYELVKRAAKKRGISAFGYMRRSVIAFVAKDLDLPFTHVSKGLPYPLPNGETVATMRKENPVGRTIPHVEEDGTNFGPWIIKELDDGPL